MQQSAEVGGEHKQFKYRELIADSEP